MTSKIEETNHQKEEITNLTIIEIMIEMAIKIIEEMDLDQITEIMMVKMVSKKEIIIDIKIIMEKNLGKEIIEMVEIMVKIISETIIKMVEMVTIIIITTMAETDLETIIDVH